MAADDAGVDDNGSEGEEKKSGRLKPLIIVGLLMLVEGVGIFATMSFLSPDPKAAEAAMDEEAMRDPFQLEGQVELPLCEVQSFNRKEGRLFVYNMGLSILVEAESVEVLEKFIELRESMIQDRVQTVIRSADPQHLNDPTMEQIKRQLRFEVNNLLGGKELVQEVLITKMLQSRANL